MEKFLVLWECYKQGFLKYAYVGHILVYAYFAHLKGDNSQMNGGVHKNLFSKKECFIILVLKNAFC